MAAVIVYSIATAAHLGAVAYFIHAHLDLFTTTKEQ